MRGIGKEDELGDLKPEENGNVRKGKIERFFSILNGIIQKSEESAARLDSA
jgi:hypothetical protein